jgi:hypothetical protein
MLAHRRSHSSAVRVWLVVGLMAAATACTSGGSPTSPSVGVPPAVTSPATATNAPLAQALRACPVTVPTGFTPPGLPRYPTYFGNRGLWTTLFANGLVIVPKDDITPDGTLGMKFPWWRGPGIRGLLHISGKELTTGSLVTAHTAGYGLQGFNASMILFPTTGCYRVTGKAGPARLSFVTLVRTCSVFKELPARQRRIYPRWCPNG